LIYYCVIAQECYDVLLKKTHLVGRSGFGADLEISDDTSISRSHAHLILVKKVCVVQFVLLVFGTNDRYSKGLTVLIYNF